MGKATGRVVASTSASDDPMSKMTKEELIAALKAQRTISFKVAPKGGLSVYGVGRFPVTLYRDQWKQLLEAKEDILAFIDANSSQLSSKKNG